MKYRELAVYTMEHNDPTKYDFRNATITWLRSHTVLMVEDEKNGRTRMSFFPMENVANITGWGMSE